MEGRARRRSLGGEGAPNDAAGEKTPMLSAATADPHDEDENQYLFKRAPRDDFSKHRLRCITNSKRAVQTLTGWARLDIKAYLAQNIEETQTLLSTVSYSLAVHSDDTLVYFTPTKGGRNPRWNHEGYVNIIAPDTMIRFHLMRCSGSIAEGLGFVEICVGDLPLEAQIEGWFELRFEENLQQTSRFRYNTHCRRRDDEVETERSEKPSSSLPTQEADLEKGDDRTLLTSKLRMHNYTCCARGPQQREQSDGEEVMKSAGEVFLSLKLTRVGTSSDALFALALKPPSPVDFGLMAVAGIRDIQGLADELNEVKLALFEDCALCVRNYFLFIITWRRSWLSLSVLLFIFMVCINEWTHGPITLATITLILFCNAFEKLRMEMACSGHNAPLTDTGFRLVAKFGDTEEMTTFLRRTIEGKVGAGVVDKDKLKLVAGRCFRDYVPLESYEDLLHRLQQAHHRPKWMKGSKSFTKGAKVLVYERFRATVTKDASGGKCNIAYEDIPKGEPQERQVDLSEDRVIFRPDVGFLNSVPMDLTGALEQQTKRARAYIDIIKSKILPIVRYISDIFVWKKPGQTRLIAWGSFFFSVVLFIFSEWYKMCGSTEEKRSPIQKWLRKEITFVKCGSAANWKHYKESALVFDHIVGLFLDHGFMVIVLIACVFLMMTEAMWLLPVKAVTTIIWRSCVGKCCPGRKAPKKWAFFRLDDDALRYSEGHSQREFARLVEKPTSAR